MKRFVLAATAGALFAGLGTAQAGNDEGVIPPATIHGMADWYVDTCADYLAKPEDQHANVIMWMATYEPQKRQTGGRQWRLQQAALMEGSAVQQFDDICTADPDRSFANVLQQTRVLSGS